MAKPKPAQTPAAAPPAPSRVLPMQLRLRDRLLDESGEWEVASRPYNRVAGDRQRPRQAVNCPDVTEIRSWDAHERVAVRRG